MTAAMMTNDFVNGVRIPMTFEQPVGLRRTGAKNVVWLEEKDETKLYFVGIVHRSPGACQSSQG